MPSLRHRAIVAALAHTPLGRRPQDEAGMDAEMQAAQLRPRRFAPPRSLDRHVALRLLRDRGVAGIDEVALILIAPWLDVTMTDPAIDPDATRDPMLSIARLRRAGELYAGPLDLRDPRVSPIYGSVAGLGPMTVFVGTRDLHLHDARRLRDEAQAHGIPVDYHEADGLIHVWPILRVPEAAAARAHMVTAIRR